MKVGSLVKSKIYWDECINAYPEYNYPHPDDILTVKSIKRHNGSSPMLTFEEGEYGPPEGLAAFRFYEIQAPMNVAELIEEQVN